MLFLVLFVATVSTICLLSVWTRPSPTREAKATGTAEPAAEPESLEGVLVTQLINHKITQMQYRHAIEGIAARDEDRHPLAVPPETGAADA